MTKLSLKVISFAFCSTIFVLMLDRLHAAQPTLFVVDSTGKTVGALVNTDAIPEAERYGYSGVVAIRLKPPSAEIVQMSITRYAIGKEATQFFAAINCTGPALLLSGLVKPAYLDAYHPGMIVMADTSAAPTLVKSFLNTTEGHTFCSGAPAGFKGYPIKSVDFSQQMFTPPFSLKLQ